MGFLKGLFENIDTKNAERFLEISVLETLFVDAKIVFEKKKKINDYREIRNSLKNLWIEYGKTKNRHFIYFLCSRKHVEFIKIHLDKDVINITLKIGKDSRKISINRKYFQLLFPDKILDITVDITNIFIVFDKITVKYDIHNFLRTFNINLDIFTNIHYIGCTKNPLTRPLNGSHKGLSNLLFELRNTDSDLFYAYNVFKLNSNNSIAKQVFLNITNTYTHELDLNFEGLLIEKILIKYFLNKKLLDNYEDEIFKLEKYKKILSNLNYISINLVFSYSELSEYYNFYTPKKSYQNIHKMIESISKNST